MQERATSTSQFSLFTGDQPVLWHPTYEDVRRRLQMLYDPKDDLILLKAPGQYMQCSGNSDIGFKIEYRDGAGDQAYLAIDQAVGLDTAIGLFASYLEQDDRWRELLAWEPAAGRGTREVEGVGRQPFRLWERDGNRLIINKKWCLITLGTLLCGGSAVSFFMINDMMDLYLTYIPGSIMAVGVIFLMLSCFVDD